MFEELELVTYTLYCILHLLELHIPKRKVHFENVRSITRFLTKLNFKSLREKIDFNSWTQHQVSKVNSFIIHRQLILLSVVILFYEF